MENMMTTKNKRLDYLDMAKGVGIILVVLGHSTYCNQDLLTIISSFHMPLFFIISGMLIMHKREEEKSFINSVKKKAVTLLVPYITFSVIYLLVDLWYLWKHPEVVNLDFIITAVMQFVSLHGISVLWFLPTLFFAEVMFLAVRKKLPSWPTVAVFFILWLLSIILKKESDQFFATYSQDKVAVFMNYVVTMILRVPVAGFLLSIGYMAKKLWNEVKIEGIWEVLLGALLLLTAAVIALINKRVDIHFFVFNSLYFFLYAAVAGSFGIILILKHCRPSKILIFFGVNSLVIMGTHLDAQVLITSIRVSMWLNQFIPRAKVYFFYLTLAGTIIVLELIIIYIFNHFAYRFIGKSRPVKKSKLS